VVLNIIKLQYPPLKGKSTRRGLSVQQRAGPGPGEVKNGIQNPGARIQKTGSRRQEGGKRRRKQKIGIRSQEPGIRRQVKPFRKKEQVLGFSTPCLSSKPYTLS
jgi:hypothetical protein